MGKTLDNLSNRFGNTVRVPTRLGYTAINTVTDSIDTLVAMPKDALDVVQHTSHEIKNILSSAWTTGKRYQRVGNIILSPFVATGAAVEGAVRTIVTPSVNGVKNAWNTGKNTVKNTWRSTFGRIFSKKPVSDFSYDKLKTANIISKEKNGFSKWRFGRKSMGGYKGKINEKSIRPDIDTSDNKGKAATAATVAPVVAPTKTTRTKKNMEIADSEGTIRDKMNKAMKDTKSDLKETFELKDDKGETTGKTESNPVKPSKTEEVKKEKIEKGETTKGTIKDKPETKSEKAIESTEKKDSGKKATESLDTEAKRKGLEEANNLLKDSPCGQKIIEGLCKKYENFGIIFDDTTCEGHHNKDSITVGSQMPKDGNNAALAPFNRDMKDKKYQTRHVLLHELAHCTVKSHADTVPEIKKGLDIIKNYIDDDGEGKTLSALTYKNDIYKSNEAKAKEDLVEMFALRMNGNGENCKKYMKLLSSDEDKELRKKYGLVTISKDDADKLQQVCDAMAKIYEE